MERQAVRRAELEELEKAHDLSVNANARSLLVGVIGLVFTLIPLVMQLVPGLLLARQDRFISGTWAVFVLTVPVAVGRTGGSARPRSIAG